MNRFKRVLLVNPMDTQQCGYTPSPLGILYLAAYLKKNNKKVDVSVIDGAIEGEKAVVNRLAEFKPDLVGISALTPARHQALKTASLAKKIIPSCKVVLGGVHPTLMWKQMMENYSQIDYIVRGEGEVTLNKLASGYRLKEINGLVWRARHKIIDNSGQTLIQDLNSIPFPAWEMIDPLKYPPRGEGIENGVDLEKEVRFSIIFSRGCMAFCTFCSSWKIWSGYRFRSSKNVADEVEFLIKRYNAKHFCFYDDTLTGARDEVISFCKEIVKRKIKIAIFGTTRVDKIDWQLLRWMKKAGFYGISYGIESGSPTMLFKINKRTDIEKIKRAVYLTKKAGIKAIALMMYGLPEETKKDLKLTEKLLKEIKPDGIGTLGVVWIFPGTALYERAKHAKLLDDRFWLGKRPYYVYRGGIGSDPINWKLVFKDTLKFHLTDTLAEKIILNILMFKQSLLK